MASLPCSIHESISYSFPALYLQASFHSAAFLPFSIQDFILQAAFLPSCIHMSIFLQLLYALTPGLFYIQQLSTPSIQESSSFSTSLYQRLYSSSSFSTLQYLRLNTVFLPLISRALFIRQLSFPPASRTYSSGSFSTLKYPRLYLPTAFLPFISRIFFTFSSFLPSSIQALIFPVDFLPCSIQNSIFQQLSLLFLSGTPFIQQFFYPSVSRT
jgi:hypothetical protein